MHSIVAIERVVLMWKWISQLDWKSYYNQLHTTVVNKHGKKVLFLTVRRQHRESFSHETPTYCQKFFNLVAIQPISSSSNWTIALFLGSHRRSFFVRHIKSRDISNLFRIPKPNTEAFRILAVTEQKYRFLTFCSIFSYFGWEHEQKFRNFEFLNIRLSSMP